MNREIEWKAGASRCSLTKLVSDPLVGLVMKSDGVDRQSIELLFERLARQRRCARRDANRRPLGAAC